MIVCETSSLIGAAINPDSVPGRAVLWIEACSRFALSRAVMNEIDGVFSRPKFARLIPTLYRDQFIDRLRTAAVWFTPEIRVFECRDPDDGKFLELALAADAECIVSSDNDLRVLNPWRGFPILSPAEFLAHR